MRARWRARACACACAWITTLSGWAHTWHPQHGAHARLSFNSHKLSNTVARPTTVKFSYRDYNQIMVKQRRTTKDGRKTVKKAKEPSSGAHAKAAKHPSVPPPPVKTRCGRFGAFKSPSPSKLSPAASRSSSRSMVRVGYIGVVRVPSSPAERPGVAASRRPRRTARAQVPRTRAASARN
jgi:hypothetical protein